MSSTSTALTRSSLLCDTCDTRWWNKQHLDLPTSCSHHQISGDVHASLSQAKWFRASVVVASRSKSASQGPAAEQLVAIGLDKVFEICRQLAPLRVTLVTLVVK